MATGNAPKRLKPTPSSATIGTHNGHFHADEALAVYMLRMHPSYTASAPLVRSRDPALLDSCHTVVDVGGVYSHDDRRYDHHQRGFDTVFPGRKTKLSSAGLVYLHFGRALVAARLAKDQTSSHPDPHDDEDADAEAENSADVGLLWDKIYADFIEAIDAADNGISAYDPAALEAAGIVPRFSQGGFGLGAMVGRLNPNWNDAVPVDAGPAEAQAAEDAKFEVASRRIGEEFARELDYVCGVWLPARDVVKAAFAKRREFDPSGRTLVLEGASVPWKDHLYALEESEKVTDKVYYVVYAEKPVPGAKWRLQAVPVTKDSFESRKPLPVAWRGTRDEALDEVTGHPGGVFVHASGFIGGHKTFEGAMSMALKAVEM